MICSLMDKNHKIRDSEEKKKILSQDWLSAISHVSLKSGIGQGRDALYGLIIAEVHILS